MHSLIVFLKFEGRAHSLRRWGTCTSGVMGDVIFQATEGTAAALRVGGVLAVLGNLGSEVAGSFGECVMNQLFD